jgi:hypothetical protein
LESPWKGAFIDTPWSEAPEAAKISSTNTAISPTAKVVFGTARIGAFIDISHTLIRGPGENCSQVSTTPRITEICDTSEQLIAGVVDTGDKYLFANISGIFEQIGNGPHGILRGPEDTDSWKNPMPKEVTKLGKN